MYERNDIPQRGRSSQSTTNKMQRFTIYLSDQYYYLLLAWLEAGSRIGLTKT